MVVLKNTSFKLYCLEKELCYIIYEHMKKQRFSKMPIFFRVRNDWANNNNNNNSN